MRSDRIENILVRGTTWLGDAVMTIPALRRLRAAFPAAQITLLAPPRAAELFLGSPLVDEVVFYRRREEGARALLEAAWALRKRRIDLAVLFQNAFEAALLARLGGARIRVGYDTQGRGRLLTHRLKRAAVPPNRHQTQDYLDLVAECERAAFGQVTTAEPGGEPTLEATAGQLSAAAELLRSYNVDPRRPLVALNAGATNSRAKCWPEERFAALADRLVDELNAQIVLIGAPSEHLNGERVIEGMQRRRVSPINLAGKTSITELVGFLAQCDLVVTNDTGPAHVAAALGKPTLTIFGPTNEFETEPLGTQAAVLRAEGVECARCMHRDCPIDHRCMTRIAAGEVAGHALSLLRVPLKQL